MKRVLSVVGLAFAMLLCAASIALCVRSYGRWDMVAHSAGSGRTFALRSADGRIQGRLAWGSLRDDRGRMIGFRPSPPVQQRIDLIGDIPMDELFWNDYASGERVLGAWGGFSVSRATGGRFGNGRGGFQAVTLPHWAITIVCLMPLAVAGCRRWRRHPVVVRGFGVSVPGRS